MKVRNRRYYLTNGGVFEISNEVLAQMLSYRQKKSNDLEAGGVLLGRFITNSKNIIVDELSKPSIMDKRTRNSFKRDQKTHQKIIDNFWKMSNGKCNYLGEWHTHPESYPKPSDIDVSSWKKILKEDVFSSRYLYFIIIGIKDYSLWEGDRRELKIKKLNYE